MFVLQAPEQAPDPGQDLYNQELDQGPDQELGPDTDPASDLDQDLDPAQDSDSDQRNGFLIIAKLRNLFLDLPKT